MGLLTKKSEKTIQDALKTLGKKNLTLIMHGSSFPSIEGEDTGFGSIYSDASKSVIDYLQDKFNSIQLGPAGKTKSCDSSPYTSTIFSDNPLFIDLKQLTTDEWDFILPESEFKSIVEENPAKGTSKTAYCYIYRRQNEALKIAFDNFKISTKLKKLQKLFDIYKHDNRYWLDRDSLYEALSVEHQNDYWPMWQSEMDKKLFNPQSIEEKIEYAKRIDELDKKYEDEIEFYKFCQFVIQIQSKEIRKYANKKDIKMIADRQVAFSDRDTWAYQSLFLDEWMLGCPPDYFSENGQAWGFPVVDPRTLFNDDEGDSLGNGGLLMKNLFKKMFRENPGGVRIDHIVGLIDPWVYRTGCNPKVEEGAGRLYSSPEHPFLKEFAIAKLENINTSVSPDNEERIMNLDKKQIKTYGRLIEKIVIQAAKEEGLDKNSIVCEDLGTLTTPVAAVMKDYNLLGMRLTQFVVPEKEDHPYRCKNIDCNCWAMVGTHDNQPISMWAKSIINTHEAYLHAKCLADDLFQDAKDKDNLIVKLTNDAEFLTLTKLVELFACDAQNVQIFFTDYFQINDVYNRPGTSGSENWSLRLPNNFKELETINLSLILKMAIEARGKEFFNKNKKLVDKLNKLCEKY